MNSQSLQSLGYTVTSFTSSHEALNYFQLHAADVDLLITDQTMPGMTGIEFAKVVKQIRRDIPVILCTGYSRDVKAATKASAGISELVMNPYLAKELGKSIRRVLTQNRKG